MSRVWIAALVGIVVVGGVACGGDDDEESTGSTASSTTAAPTTTLDEETRKEEAAKDAFLDYYDAYHCGGRRTRQSCSSRSCKRS